MGVYAPLWILATLALIGVDQGFKWWVASAKPYFALQQASLSFYPNYDGPFQLRLWWWLLQALAVTLLITVYFLFRREPHMAKKIALWLILAGGLSIAGERFIRGFVIDMFRIGTLVFNLADVAVVAGLGMFIVLSLKIVTARPLRY